MRVGLSWDREDLARAFLSKVHRIIFQQSDFPLTQVEQLTSRPDNLGLSGPRKEREVRLEQVDDGDSGDNDDNGSGGEEGQAEQESDLFTMWLPSHSFGENTEKKVESLVEKIGNFNHFKEKIINFIDFEELTIKLFFSSSNNSNSIEYFYAFNLAAIAFNAF